MKTYCSCCGEECHETCANCGTRATVSRQLWPEGSLQEAMRLGDRWRRTSWGDPDVYILRNSGATPLWSFGSHWQALADDLVALDWVVVP